MRNAVLFVSLLLVRPLAGAEVPIQVVTSIKGSFVCALGDEGHVRCWGNNNRGQSGSPQTGEIVLPGSSRPPVDLDYATHGKALTLAVGTEHACAAMEDKSVLCWGRNEEGELGRGNTQFMDRLGKTLIPVNLGSKSGRVSALTAGARHTCALFDSGAVKCWGDGGVNRLASKGGINTERPEQFGDRLPELHFSSGKAIQISAGYNHTCVLTEARAVHCWGDNSFHQLGHGRDFYLFGRERKQVPDGSTGQELDLGLASNESVVNVQAGVRHTCALIRAEGAQDRVKCWGMNESGALGVGKPGRIQHRSYEEPYYRDAQNSEVVLLGLETGDSIRSLSVGEDRNCVLLTSGRVKCWGENGSGELGEGDKATRSTDEKDMGFNLPYVSLAPGLSVQSISYRADFGCAIIGAVGEIKCWGQNDNGQAGTLDRFVRGVTPDEMGNNLPYVDVGF